MKPITLKTLRRTAAALLAAALWSGCGDTEAPVSGNPDRPSGAEAAVTLRVAASAPVEVDGDGNATRAIVSMLPSEENHIHNMIVVQFYSSGLLVPTSSRYVSFDEGVQGTTLKASFLKDEGRSFICILANVGSGDDACLYLDKFGYLWQRREDGTDYCIDTSQRFREMLVDLPVETDADGKPTGHLTKMYMYAVREGSIEDDGEAAYDLNVGRLCAKFRIILRNGTGEPFNGTLRLKNAPRKVRFMPLNANSGYGPNELMVYEETVTDLQPDEEHTYYYYTGEQLFPAPESRTYLEIEGDDGLKGTLPLGYTPPEAQHDNPCIYRNCLYNIVVNLKKE